MPRCTGLAGNLADGCGLQALALDDLKGGLNQFPSANVLYTSECHVFMLSMFSQIGSISWSTVSENGQMTNWIAAFLDAALQVMLGLVAASAQKPLQVSMMATKDAA
jgi:hypothetical protein